jgi:hypothetical protein
MSPSSMKRYLLSIYQPDGPVPTRDVLDKINQDLAALNREMKGAGAWVFAAGLYPPSTATVVMVQAGELLITDGPFTEAKEHIGGFTIISAPDLDAALEWGSKFARATTLPVEVRPMQDEATD